jgi:L-lysine 6-transaminase
VARLGRAAINKPSNSDLYSVEMAEFVDAFRRLAQPAELPHLFVIEGGTLGVENAMKTAMDWKVRKNLARGRGPKAARCCTSRNASTAAAATACRATNTDPVKVMHFSKFEWPRISNPKLSFPVTAQVQEAVAVAERKAVAEIEHAFTLHRRRHLRHPHRDHPGRGRRQSLPRRSSSASCAGWRTRTTLS